MKNNLFAFIFLVIYAQVANANIVSDVFRIGVDAEVETTIKVDPQILSFANNLPKNLRIEFVKAANEIISQIDGSVVDAFDEAELLLDGRIYHADSVINSAIINLSGELRQLTYVLSEQLECTGMSVIDKFFEETRKSLPWYRSGFGLFEDSCEKLIKPDKSGLGPQEKLIVAHCWVNEVLDKNTTPAIIAAKNGKLQKMANEARCLMRGTNSESVLHEKSMKYGDLYRIFDSLDGTCERVSSCLDVLVERVRSEIGKLDKESVEYAKLVEKIKGATSSIPNASVCNMDCWYTHFLSLNTIQVEAKTIQNSKRLREAEDLYGEAYHGLSRAKAKAEKAWDMSGSYTSSRDAISIINNEVNKETELAKGKYAAAVVKWPSLNDKRVEVQAKEKEIINYSTKAVTRANYNIDNYGPDKSYRGLKAGVYLTKGYWAKGHAHTDFWCLDGENIDVIPNMIKFGAVQTKKYSSKNFSIGNVSELIKSAGCKGNRYCDSAGEFCESFERTAGCLVSNKWLGWYRARNKALGRAENQSEICTSKQSPWVN